MQDIQIAKSLARFPTGNLCNAHPEVKALHSSIAPLYQGAKIFGTAKTAKITPGQNAAIHRAVDTAKSGDVLIVDSDNDIRFGPFGDILATCCRNQGVTGLVINSTIRDTAEIRKMRFPVYCLGANPTATAKTDPGEIDIEINCGGVFVHPGDFIIGDDDGVVIVPKKLAREIIDLAAVVARKEVAIHKRLQSGETTSEIFDIRP